MPTFVYTALKEQGENVRGSVKAVDREGAVKILQARGIFVVKLQEEMTFRDFSFFDRVSVNDLVFITRQFAILFSSSISGVKAINLTAQHLRSPNAKRILTDIAKEVEEGKTLAQAFSKYEHIFGTFFIGLVSVGEESGDLPNTFSYLADYFEQNRKIKNDIIKAVTYPIIVVIVLVVVVLFLFTTVVPQMAEVLKNFNADLPLITHIVLGISDIVGAYFYYIIIGFTLSIVSFGVYIRTPDGSKAFDIFVLKIPLFSRLIHTFYHIRFSDSLAILLQGGVPLLKSLEIVEVVFSNSVYKRAIQDIIVHLKSGVRLSYAIEKQGLFDKTVSGIVATGEETGNIGKILKNASRLYRQQFEVTVNLVTSLIQPITIVFLGITVGGTIAAIMLPIYSLAGSL